MSYQHGVSTGERPTSVLPPATSIAGLPVVFGTAPVNMSQREKAPVNEPILCNTYQEAVQTFGFSYNWKEFTLSEFIDSHFSKFQMSPVVLVNVLDPETHKKSESAQKVNVTNGVATIEKEGVLLDSLVVKSGDGTTTYEIDDDYVAAFNNQVQVVITIMDDGAAGSETELQVDYDHLDPSAITGSDIIGGVDGSGKSTGLELVNEVFPRYRLVPGLILAPGFSSEPDVAAVMAAKAGNINGLFKAVALTDLPSDVVTSYTEAPQWKNDNNYTSERQINCWPKVTLGDNSYNLSTQLAGVINAMDAANGGVPYVSPSNQSLQADGSVLADGTEVFLGPDQAAYLNGEGIVTALNFVGGWRAWGNRTGAYPATTDPKDSFIPVRRMFDWIQNSIILSTWQRLDGPITKRLVTAITDSLNVWMNGLTAAGNILGGRVEFNASDNPDTDVMDGIIRFRVYVTPPSPGRQIDFIVEYDAQYLSSLVS